MIGPWIHFGWSPWMGPTISVSHWLDFWVLIIIVRVLISKPQSIPFHPCFLERFNRCIRLRSCSCLGGLWACSQYVPIVEKVTVWWRSARGQALAFYGSWTLFTDAHHNTVWLSTELVDPGLLPMLSLVPILLSEMRRWQLSSSVASLWDIETLNQGRSSPFPLVEHSINLVENSKLQFYAWMDLPGERQGRNVDETTESSDWRWSI